MRFARWSARWVRRCRGSGGTCVNRAGCRRSRGGAESVICPWRNVRRSHAGSPPACRHGRSPGVLTDRRRRCRGRLPAMVAAMRTGHWSPTRRRFSGRGARNRASSPPTRSYGMWSLTSSTTIGHRSRSPSGCGGSFAMTRRCGSRMNRSIVTCICRRGKCLTPPCSTVCGASVRSDGRAERSIRTVAARSGTWSPSVSDRPRPTPDRWPAIGRAISCSERARRRWPPSLTAPPVTRWSWRCPTATRPTRWRAR